MKKNLEHFSRSSWPTITFLYLPILTKMTPVTIADSLIDYRYVSVICMFVCLCVCVYEGRSSRGAQYYLVSVCASCLAVSFSAFTPTSSCHGLIMSPTRNLTTSTRSRRLHHLHCHHSIVDDVLRLKHCLKNVSTYRQPFV